MLNPPALPIPTFTNPAVLAALIQMHLEDYPEILLLLEIAPPAIIAPLLWSANCQIHQGEV